ncbi:MAG: hypothetical protein Q4C98_05600 [Capnocytophaga sp.]|nr:hypothetical protein [Capnocytophaga sp.]
MHIAKTKKFVYTPKKVHYQTFTTKKTYWYEAISRAHYEFEKVKPLRADEPIEIRAVKTCFTIADTTNGKVFLNLFDGSVWHFTDDSDWLNDIDLYHCEKYANSFNEFLQLLSKEPISDKSDK